MPNYDYRRLQPADQLVYDTRGNLVGIRAGTSGDQAIFGLNEAEYPAVQALVSDAGKGLGIPEYAARYESAIAQAFRLKAPNSLPTIPETLPAVVAGPTYYVDPLDPAASDSNAGTSRALPWATLGKLSALTPGNGAVILLAGDASFTLAESWTTYKAHGTVGLVDISNMRGTASQPITIKP